MRNLILAAALLLGCTVVGQRAAAVNTARTSHNGAALARLQALRGAMPTSFDIWAEDPCGGPWTMSLASINTDFAATFMRFEGIPIVHVEGAPGLLANVVTTQLARHSLRFTIHKIVFTMTCLPGGASGDAAVTDGTGTHHVAIAATSSIH